MVHEELHYPNLQFCSIIPAISSGTNHRSPSVSISPECLEAMSASIPDVYDYKIEESVMEKQMKMEHDSESPLIREAPDQRNDVKSTLSLPQRDMLRKMKSVTNASEDECASILQKNNFDMNISIDAYFRDFSG